MYSIGMILGKGCKDNEAILMSRRVVRKLLLEARELRIIVCIDQIMARCLHVLIWKTENVYNDLIDSAKKS